MRDLMVVTGVWLQAAEPVVGGAQAKSGGLAPISSIDTV